MIFGKEYMRDFEDKKENLQDFEESVLRSIWNWFDQCY
jgi:hypothetical protein